MWRERSLQTWEVWRASSLVGVRRRACTFGMLVLILSRVGIQNAAVCDVKRKFSKGRTGEGRAWRKLLFLYHFLLCVRN